MGRLDAYVISTFLAGLMAAAIQLPEHLLINLYPWAQQTAGLNKISSLLTYVIPVIVMFIYYPITLFVSTNTRLAKSVLHQEHLPKLWLFFLMLILINVGLLFVNQEKIALVSLLIFLWAFILFKIPNYILYEPKSTIHNSLIVKKLIIKKNWFWGGIIFLVSLHYLTIFVPLVNDQMIIGQDYVHVSQRTILENGKIVDNLDYINEHKISGLQIYDPRKSTAGTLIKVEDCQQLYQNLISINDSNNAKIDCDVKTNYLIVRTPFVSLEVDGFKELLSQSPYSKENLDFVSRNTESKLENQVKRGFFFYHHGYNFGPMNALSLGASSENQTMVYGWLSTVMQGKILESLNMLNYQGYFKAFFSIYIIYFALFLLGIWLIYRGLGTVVFAGVLAATAVLALGLELIKLAPGFNPVRHLFDVPAFYFLYLYLSGKRNIYLVATTTLSLFAVLWSKDLGLFLATSVGGTLILFGFTQRPFHRLPLLAGVFTVAIGMLLFLYPFPGGNPTAVYMLLGVGSPLASSKTIFILIVLVSVLLLATIWIKQSLIYKILTVGMAFYFIQGLTYYVWYPELHHLWGVAPVFIFWLTALYHGWATQYQDTDKAVSRQFVMILSMLLIMYFPAAIHFTKERKEYLQLIKKHELYQWSFEKGTFVSTMEPLLFEDAVKLIKQYNADNSIYIISKYDHILPILAGKYSAMPYNELLTNLVSVREVTVAAKVILKNSPKYLFVDSDIGNSFISGQSNANTINHSAEVAARNAEKIFSHATARERLLVGLNDVFALVSDQYEKCKAGQLITVYCKKI